MGFPYNFETGSRLPVRPLSIDSKDLAVPKEILIDYKNGVAYVCDENKNIIDIGANPKTIATIAEYFRQYPELITNNITVSVNGKDITLRQILLNHETEINDLMEDFNELLDHIPVIDKSLTKEGQAADAKAVGDAITMHNNKVASQTENGHFHFTDKKKLDGIEEGANKYTLPVATSATLGGVKVDTELSNSSTNPVQNNVINARFVGIDTALNGKSPTSHNHDNLYLKLGGGTLTGPLTVPTIILGSGSYGPTLPSSGTEGQLFFKLI